MGRSTSLAARRAADCESVAQFQAPLVPGVRGRFAEVFAEAWFVQ